MASESTRRPDTMRKCTSYVLQATDRYGPKGFLLEATNDRYHRYDEHDLSLMTVGLHHLTWTQKPTNVLVIKKFRDSDVTLCFKRLIGWLHKEKNMTVYVEVSILHEEELSDDASFQDSLNAMIPFIPGEAELIDKIDFIICLGGDGTLLYASSLFESSAPPLIGFHLGSLGFLTPFSFENFESAVSCVIEGTASLTLRMRLRCEVVKCKRDKPPAKTSFTRQRSQAFNEAPAFTSLKLQTNDPPKTDLLVLNEVVIDRGASPYLTNFDIYCNDHVITSVQGDGVIIATPTGSTAYAAAAGSSMVHPSIPAIILTPICPHSLSFRPILIPATSQIRVVVSSESRHHAWVAFDGRSRQPLTQGDSVLITASQWPLPCVSANDHITDWFKSLSECLHWNVRRKQMPMEQ